MINKFISANPGFSIQTADLYHQPAINNYNWEGLDQAATLQALRIRQRLLRINPDEAVAATLELLGYHSAHQLAMEQEPVFSKKYSDAAGAGGRQQAKAIYAAAQAIRSRSWMLATLPAPADVALPNDGDQLSRPDFQEGIPNYERLFGPMLYCDCKECMSIYGPAAYFTDLMRVIGEYIVPDSTKAGDSWFALNKRRPDLWQLPLDCITANHEVSYLSIVNNILEQNISANYLNGGDTAQAAATGIYPFSAPYNLPLTQIRAYLAAMGTGLPQIYKSLQTAQPAESQELLNLSAEQYALITGSQQETLAGLYGFYDASISDADLTEALSTQQVFLEKTGLTANDLEALVYQNLRQGNGLNCLSVNPTGWDGNTGNITNSDFAGTITIEFWVKPHDFNHKYDIIAKCSQAEFSICISTSGQLCFYYGTTYQTGSSCKTAASSISQFSTKLLQAGVWSFVSWVRDLTTGVNSIYINGILDSTLTPSSAVIPATSGCPLYIGYFNNTSLYGCLSEIRIWNTARTEKQIRQYQYKRITDTTNPELLAYWPANEGTGTTIHDLSTNHYNATIKNTTTTPAWVYIPDDPFTESEINPALVHSLFINSVLQAGQYIYLPQVSAKNSTTRTIAIANGTIPTALNDTALRQLAAFMRLQQQTGWDAETLDWAILSVAGGGTAINAAVIEQLGGMQLLHTQYGIDIIELCSFWKDMKTYGRGNGALPQDLWDRVFNTPPLMLHDSSGTQPPYYRPIYAPNPLFQSPLYTWTYKGTTKTQDVQVRNALNAALAIADEELTAIASKLTTGETIDLTVPVLSNFYRIARFAKMVSLPVKDFLLLLDTLGKGFSTWSVKETLEIADTVKWMKAAAISCEQLAYILNGTGTSKTVTATQLQEKAEELLKTLWQGATAVRIMPDSFISENINQAAAQAVYRQLIAKSFIDKQGLVLKDYKAITPASIYEALQPLQDEAAAVYQGNITRHVLNFQGGSDQVLLNFDPFADATIQNTNSFTLAFWAMPQTLTSEAWPRMAGNTAGNSNSTKSPGVLQYQGNGSLIQLQSGYNSNFYTFHSEDYFRRNKEWVFVTWVNNGGMWTLYRNGEIAPPETPPQHIGGIYTQPAPGTYYLGTSFFGNMANLSVWNIALTAEEVNELMFADLAGNETGLIGYWPMNEGAGTSINDKQTNTTVHNGTMQGSPAWVQIKIPADLPVLHICKVLKDGLKNQDQYVLKSLSGLFGLTGNTMAAVCNLSSHEFAFVKTGNVIYPVNQLLNMDTTQAPDQKTYIEKIVQNVTLVKTLKLTSIEMLALLKQPQIFDAAVTTFSTSNINLAQLKGLSTYKGLCKLFGDTKDLLLAYFEEPLWKAASSSTSGTTSGSTSAAASETSGNTPNAAQIQILSDISGWSVDDITSLVGHSSMSHINFNTVAGVRVMADVFGICAKANINLDTLYLFASLAAINLYTSTNAAAGWQTWLDAADAATAAAKTKLSAVVLQNTADTLLENWRTALCNWLIWQLSSNIKGVNTPDDLYEYLLTDVKMTASVNTSPLVAGMNSLQLYVNRCYNNLEPAVINKVPVAWWEWMYSYRVWQANREVYLYPENYVDPSLRKIQSPEFKQLISDIAKGQVNETNAAAALTTYLESVQEIASLELADGYVVRGDQQLPGMDADEQKNILFLIGKSRTSPPTYYSRMVLGVTDETAVTGGSDIDAASQLSFGPWEPINLSINSDYLSTVYAFGKQFIFWVEQNQKTYTNNGNNQFKAVYATIYYSWRNLSQTWVEPVTLKRDILVQFIGETSEKIEYYNTSNLQGSGVSSPYDNYYYLQKCCNAVKLQMLPAQNDMPEQIMVVFGAMVYCPASETSPGSLGSMSAFTEVEKEMQQMLYKAAVFAYSCKPNETTIVPAILLSPALTQSELRLNINNPSAYFVRIAKAITGTKAAIGFYLDNGLFNEENNGAPLPQSNWPFVANNGYVSGSNVIDIVAGITGTFNNPSPPVVRDIPPLGEVMVIPFSGSDYAEIPWAAYNAVNAFTAGVWFYIPSADEIGNYAILNTYIGLEGWSIGIYHNYLMFAIGGTVYYSIINGEKITLQTNTWYFAAISPGVNASTDPSNPGTFFVNGESQTIPPYTGLPTTNENLYVGLPSGYDGFSNANFKGYIANLKIWTTPLSNQQLLDEYNTFHIPKALFNLPSELTSVSRIGNSAGTYAVTIGSQSYLAIPDTATNLISDCITVSYPSSGDEVAITFAKSPITDTSEAPQMKFVRVSTDTISPMMQALTAGGVDALLTLNNQYLPEASLAKYAPTAQIIQPDTNFMDFEGAFGIYFWEIFFYAPYLVAGILRSGQQFAAAQKWYQYIFNPAKVNPLAAYWPLGGMSGNNAIDAIGGNTATATNLTVAERNSTPFSLMKREVATFNGSSAYITVPYTPQLNTPEFTVMAWVYLAEYPGSEKYNCIISCRSGSWQGYAFYFYGASNNETQFQLWLGDGLAWSTLLTQSFTTGVWTHVAITYDGADASLYINGQKLTTSSYTGYDVSTANDIIIGAVNPSSPACFFNGNMADLAYYQTPLTAGHIADIYNNYQYQRLTNNVWQFAPFRRLNATSLYHILRGDTWKSTYVQPLDHYTAPAQISIYEYDPFDPDTLARLRVTPFQKALFMAYIQNLINWGDQLFTQDTWETLTDATMNYVLAAGLLGKPPVKEVVEAPQPPVTYQQIATEYGTAGVPQFLIDMESSLSGLGATATIPQQVQSIIDAYFCIPANTQLLQCWKTVADRLYKLRHGLTITGQQNDIPLYAPPVNPASLVAASASGGGTSATTAANPMVPYYRFSYLINQAKSLAGEASRLGSELLAALEKQDAEQLSQMQASYQTTIYNLTTQIKTTQINELQYTNQSLHASLANAQYLQQTYAGYIEKGLSPGEINGLIMESGALLLQDVVAGIRAASTLPFLFPNVFGLADGGMEFGESVAAAAGAIETIAQVASAEGQLSNAVAQYMRRNDDWVMQMNTAANQVNEINAQIQANNCSIQAAQQDLSLTQTQYQQSVDIYNFLQTKFTNVQLYQWMSGQVSSLYYQMYQLAFSFAQSTQSAFQYEMNSNQNFLNAAAWNSTYQGLLAGDALGLSLNQMESAYINGNNRKLQIRKTWSMRQNNPQALVQLVENGVCNFSLSETLYDQDFPGQYNRKIKMLSISIPAVVGPYQNIHGTLVQTSNSVVTKPNIQAVEYLAGVQGVTMPTDGSLRVNWNPNQEIVLSTGMNDNGMFQVNFNDEQYLPFEGTGAVSSWNLSIPQAANAFNLRSISDVILTIDYEADDAGATFKSSVISQVPGLTTYTGNQYISLRQACSGAWFNFLSSFELPVGLVPQMYPANISGISLGNSTGEVLLIPVFNKNIKNPLSASGMAITLSGNSWSQDNGTVQAGASAMPVSLASGVTWPLAVTMSVGTDNPLLLPDGKIDPTALLDILMMVPFSGSLTW